MREPGSRLFFFSFNIYLLGCSKRDLCCSGVGGGKSLVGPSFLPREGNGNPLQYFFLENPRDGGARWAAVYGVAESDTTEAT